ncbi:MAG: hypothetical protein LKK00_09990 [Intestinimonas sp.]|nr:hypothetical protein [Intestinimonas sp.]
MADDFNEQLNAILGNPDAMGQIMSIARAITGGGQGSSAQGAAPASAPAKEQSETNVQGDLSSVFSQLDPRIIQLGMQLFSAWNKPDDSRTALLTALRPFVREERFERLDQAIQIARLSRVIREAIRIFRDGEGGGGDV